LRIAVDIDGVLADQVGAFLKIIEKEYGCNYHKSDVNRAHWTFCGKDIWMEISRLLNDPEYVLAVPVIDGSQEAIQQLPGQDVHVATARRPETEKATKQWLRTHFPCLTEYHHARTGSKHVIPSDVLIDDFDLNIVEFVKSDPNRRGILFQQPWSINDLGIENYADQVYFCSGWQSVLRVIDEIEDTSAFVV
jgi:5'(3')-deoxyribonucleotidase